MYAKRVFFIVLLAVAVAADKTYQEQFNDAKDKVSNSLTEFQKSFMSNSVTESAMDSLRSSFKNFNDIASQSSSEMTQEMSDSMTETKKQLESQITSMMRQIGLDASDPSQISQFQAKLKGVTPDSMRSMLNEMFTTYGYIKGAAANQWWNMKDNVAKMTQSYSDALWNNNVADYLSNQYHQYFGPSADTYQEQFQRAADDVSNSMQQFQSQYFTRSTAVTNEALESVKLSFHRFNELARQAPDTLPDEVSHKLTRTKFLMSQQVTALMRQLGIDSNETSKLSELQSKFQQTSSDSMQSFLNEMFTTYGYVKGSVATEWWNVKENVAQMIKSYTNALRNNQVTEYVAMKYHQYIAPAADAVKQEL